MSKKVLLADDHGVLRLGLRILVNNLLSDCFIEESDTVERTLALFRTHQFDYAIVDVQLQDGNMIDVLADLVMLSPQTGILVYSVHNEEVIAPKIFRFGARGFLSKMEETAEVSVALQRLFSGEEYVSRRLSEKFGSNPNGLKSENPLSLLSPREFSVFYHLIRGETVKEISSRFALSPNTITTLKGRIYEKLHVANLIELKELADLYYVR